MKIAVVLFKTLGDILMGTTVVRALKQKFPDSTIDFITQAQNVNILEGNPDISKIVVKEDYWQANLHIIDNGYDEVFRLAMSNLYDTCWHHLPDQQNQHLVEWYAKRAGIDKLDDPNIYINLSNDDIADVDDYWSDLPSDKKIVGFHTSTGAHYGGARVNSKDWPIEYFNNLATQVSEAGYTIVQLGAFNDKKIKAPGIIDLTGKFSFKQNAEAIKRCSFFFGLDSGPSYLAGWAGTKSIIMMGATQNQTKDNNGPAVGSRNSNVTYINPARPDNPNCKPVPCYVNCQIKDFYGCIASIQPAEVFSKFQELIK
jgi:heptosyltransferase-3